MIHRSKINFRFSIVILAFLLAGFLSIQAQSNKKSEKHAQEIMEADANALAYITCKYELKKYESAQSPEDKYLKSQERATNMTFSQISAMANIKYRRKPELYPKFERLARLARKELTLCIKYQNILDVLEEMEKKSQ